MKTLPLSLIAGAFLLSAGAVSALEGEATGKIRTVNPQAGSIVTESGHQFRLGEGVSLQGLKPGMTVKIHFKSQSGLDEDDGGGMIATKIEVVPKG